MRGRECDYKRAKRGLFVVIELFSNLTAVWMGEPTTCNKIVEN